MKILNKIGLYGGSFDPVHKAHIDIAKELYKSHKLDLIYFVPVSQSPLKKHTPIASDVDRLNMLKLAIQDYPPFDIWDWEIQKGGTSYTIDSVEFIKSKNPKADLFWLIGEDQVKQLPQWHRIHDLVKLVTFIAIKRPPHTTTQDPHIPGLKLQWLLTYTSPLSSSQTRKDIKSGKSVAFCLPDGVSQYIASHKLYT